MAKKGNRLRSFEKNNRVLDISSAQEKRQEKRKKEKEKKMKTGNSFEAAPDGEAAAETSAEKAAQGAAQGKGRSRLVRLAGLGISLIFIFIVGMSVKNIYDLKEQEAAVMDRHEELLQMKEELTLQLENVNSDEFIEEQARRELKLIKGNELIFYFTEESKSNE